MTSHAPQRRALTLAITVISESCEVTLAVTMTSAPAIYYKYYFAITSPKVVQSHTALHADCLRAHAIALLWPRLKLTNFFLDLARCTSDLKCVIKTFVRVYIVVDWDVVLTTLVVRCSGSSNRCFVVTSQI